MIPAAHFEPTLLAFSKVPARDPLACALTELNLHKTLALEHSWALCEQPRQFELGAVLNSAITEVVLPKTTGLISVHHAGCWECDVTDNSLIWSGGVYDIFGMPRGIEVTRAEAVGFYREESRATMETLRAYAVKHRRGFTLDVELQPASGGSRWMRLIAAPVVENGVVVRLHGLKLAI